MLGQVADAINNAPDIAIISGSEYQVCDLFGTLRQQAFEVGLQMRIDAAEAAFPPPREVATGNKGRQEYSVMTLNEWVCVK